MEVVTIHTAVHFTVELCASSTSFELLTHHWWTICYKAVKLQNQSKFINNRQMSMQLQNMGNLKCQKH